MADVNSNININFNTAAALAQLRSLQAGLSKFHQSLAEGNLAAANAQKGLNAQLLQSIGATGKFSASQVKVAGSTLAFTSALEKNKLSLREYYRYTMAAATANTRVMGKAFAQEREIINRARRDRVKALQAQYIQMNKANSGFMDAIRVMPKSLQMASGKFTELGTRIQYAAQRQQFLNQLLKQGSTQLLNFGKNTQWAGRQLMVGLTMPLALFGAAAAKAFKELDAEIVKFRRVYGDAFTNDAEVNAAVENIRKLGNEYTKYGVSVTKTMEMAATAAAAGFQGDALTAQVETATKLSVLGQIEQQQALETTISLQSAFGISSDELAKKINFLNAVENQTLLSIEDLTIAIPKAAPVVKQLGGSVEDLAFFLTAMKEGGINASEGANALKSGLASLINPSDKAAKFMGNLGINIKGLVEANKGDIKGTVVGFARALDELDPLNRARAIEQMFGKFQFSRLSTLFQNVTKDGSQASRALDLAGASIEELAVLSEREMKKIEDSTGVKFQAAIEKFKQEIMPLGKAFLEALTPVVKFFGSLFEKFNGLSDQTKKVVATIVAVVAGLGPVVLMTFGLLANGVANVIKFFAMLRGGIAKLNGQTSVMGAGFNYMTQEQIENAASSQQLHQTHTRLIEVFNVEKASVAALAASYNSLSTQMRSMAAQNPALFSGGMGGAKRAVTKLPPVKKYAEGILSVPGPKGAGDVVPAMLSPGEAVIPTETTDKYRGLITAMFQDKVPGFMAGRLPGGPGRGIPLSAGPAAVRDAQQARYRRRDDARQGYNEPHPERKSGPTFVGMPKSSSEASQSRQILDKISNSVKAGRFADVPPTDFGTMLQAFSGRSFPVRGVGGVYRKPNGQIVVVKPTMDDKTALAEVRATQIAREVHGLVSPKQTIRTMIDPTDPTGQRKFVVVESPYDPRIASMSGKFSKSDMIKQLVASTLRGDKDLQKPNLSGNVLADVGTAGVFDRASGFRDFAKVMPSMEEQAIVNLLGVKGGAKKFFAQETSGIAAQMTPKQYDDAIKAEIKSSIPRLERVIKSFDLDPVEQLEYAKMLERLRVGAKTDWAALHPMHARAGEGIKKLEFGNFDEIKNMPDSREQIARLKERLSIEAVQRLKTLPEEQQEKVLAALRKQKPAATEAMSQSRMIDFVEKNMVYKDGLFHDKKSLDAGRQTAGKTYEQVMKKVFYQMGLIEKDGQFVSDKKINMPSRLRDAMSPEGKAGGGWRTNVPKDSLLWKALDQEEQRFRAANMVAGSNDPLKAVREKLSALGYNEKQIARELRSELSHTEKTGESGRGPAKYLKGSAMFDLRILNNFMNAKSRHQNILDWNAKNGYPIIPESQVGSYAKAAAFMGPGSHPTTLAEVKLVQKAAQLDALAENYLKQQTTKPKNFPNLGEVRASRGVLALLKDRIGTGYYDSSQPVFNLASGPDKTQKVLVDPRNEFKVDTATGKITKLTTANTGAKPAGAFPDSGSSRDTRTTTESRTQRVATRSQARRFGRMFAATPGFSMPGRIKGDPGLRNPTVKQGELATELRRKGFSQSEIDRTLRRFAERELRNKEAQVKESEKAARTEAARQKEQAAIQKRQTEAGRQRFLEQERRAQLNAAQARHYDAAIEEDRQRTLKANRQTQKQKVKEQRMARQQRAGAMSGGLAMGLGMAGSGMMMAGNVSGGMAMMGASAVAGLAPMFAGMGPGGLIATGVVTVGASLLLLNKHLEKSAIKQAKYVDSISATTEKMDKVGEITQKVGASRAMEQVRLKGSFGAYNDVQRAGTGFGDTFLRSEVGKSMVDGFVEEMKASGSEVAAKDFALQLASYVSDGVLDASQAADIADQIGIQLGSRKYTAEIMGDLRSIIGPNGEDLATNPLRVRMQIVQETDKRSSSVVNRVNAAANNSRTDSAQLAAYSVNSISIAKAQADATEFEYRKQIQLLEKQLESVTNAEKMLEIKEKIATLEGNMARDIVITNKAYADQIDKEVKRFNKSVAQEGIETPFGSLWGSQVDDQKEDAYFDSLKSKVKDAFSGTEFATMATSTLSKLAKLGDQTLNPFDGGKTKGGFENRAEAQEFEVRMSMLLADKALNPEQLDTFMRMFEGNLPELQQVLSIGIEKHGAGATTEMLEFFAGFDDEDGKIKELSTKIIKSNPKEFKEVGETLAQLRALDGHEVNMEAFIKTGGYDELVALSKDLATIEAMPDKLDKELILKYFSTGDGKGVAGTSKENLEVLFAQWDDFNKLPDKAQKEAISKFTTIIATIFQDEKSRRRYAQEQGDLAARESGFRGRTAGAIKKRRIDEIMSGTLTQAQAAEAARKTETYIGKNGELVTKEGGEYDEESGGGTKVDPYANLLKRLKEVRNAAIDASGGIQALNKALAEGNVSSIKNKYQGTEQQLQAQGYNQGFIDFIQNMDPKEQSKFMRTSSKATKGKYKGQVVDPFTGKPAAKGKPPIKAGKVFLSEDAKSIGAGFDGLVSGEFNTQAQRQVQSLKYQEDAYRKLRDAGYDHLTAQKIISDEYLAQSVSTGKLTEEEIKQNALLAKEITNREKINGLIQSGRDKINEQSMYIAKSKDEISKVQELLEFLGKRNVKFGEGAVKDIIGDPETLAALIAGMENVNAETEGAAKAMDELVAGVKALKDNSDITLAIKIATQTVSETVNQGAQAAQRINETLTGVYKNLTPAQLANVTSTNPTTKITKNTGAQAVKNVADRYAAAGATVPTISPIKSAGLDSSDTVRSVQKERANLGKTISIAQSNANAAAQAYSNIMDSIRKADEDLRNKIDEIQDKYKPQISAQEDIIEKAEDVLDKFRDDEEKLNKENSILSNDLAIIDNLSDEINKKYDKQVEALQTVNDLNQQIAESQSQQLDLADALSQGDIAAAARAAQTMRATSAANQGDALMQGLEKSRENELGGLIGPESKKTRLEIEKEQFRISQALYALENDPARVTATNAIKDARTEIERLEKLITAEVKAAEAAHTLTVEKFKTQAEDAKKIADSAAATVTSLVAEDTALASIEEYLTAVAEEAAALDESTGFTLQDYLDMIEKFPNLVKLSEDYQTAIVAGEVAAGKMNTSWEGILKSINDIPATIDIKSVLDIIENITRNITEYVTTVYTTATGGNSTTGTTTTGTSTTGTSNPAPGKAWIKDGNGVWIKPTKPVGDYGWSDTNGWVKGYAGSDTNGSTDSAAETKLRADAIAKTLADAAEAKKAADALAAQKAADAKADATNLLLNDDTWWSGTNFFRAKGGLINPMKFAMGGFAKGTDTVPAMLTPGEFVMSKYAVQSHGIDTMKAINSGQSTGGAVYNNTYALTVNAKTDANPNEIAQAVMSTIKQVDDRRIRGVSFNAR